MKGGKVILRPIEKTGLRIVPARAFFFDSHHIIFRGLLKGWMPSIARILRGSSHKGDVLYTAIEPNLLVTYLNGRIAKKLGLKHVFFTWQNVAYTARLSGLKLRLTEWLIRKNIVLSSGAICGNEKARVILSPYLPQGFKTVTIPISGVDTDQFRPGIPSDFRNVHGLNGKIIATFVGALDKRKGISTMLEAFTIARIAEPHLHLVIIGAGPLDGFVDDYISRNNLSGSVLKLPWLPNEELPGILCSSDIFLYPSEPHGGWEEQFGYSIAEASSCGLPVISTASGSIPDKIIHNQTGLLIAPGDVNQLQHALTALTANKDMRKRMGNAGRQFIIEHFSHEIIARKMETFLRTL